MVCILFRSVLLFPPYKSLRYQELAHRIYLLILLPGRKYQDSELYLLLQDVQDSEHFRGIL